MSEESCMPINLYYGRAGEAVGFRTRGMSTHELRALIFGLWLYPPPVSVAIAEGYRRGGRMS